MRRQGRIWLLKHRRAGDLAQMRNLATKLGNLGSWIVEEKQLVFRFPGLVRFPAAASGLLDRHKSDKLEPPWPDLIIVAEAVASWVAKALKARAGAQTKVIVLGRPAGETSAFDLILATAQYDVPQASNIVTLPVPLATSPPAAVAERQKLVERMAGKSRPWIAVLIGGSVPPDRLDKEAAAKIAEAARLKAQASGGSLILLTSPRTGKARDEELEKLLAADDLVLLWSAREKPNLYGAVLAEADLFLVTSDSISMTVEALNTGKPVSLFMLPQQAPFGLRMISALNRAAGLAVKRPALAGRAASPLFKSGILEAPAHRQRFYRDLIARGMLSIYPDFPVQSGAALADEAEVSALAAVEKLFA